MKPWVLFLFGSLVAGGFSMRRGRAERAPRPALMLLASVALAVALYSQRFQ
jgi:hypothetical protein